MKIKKYTNGAWTDLDKPVKKYATYTDEATTLPLTIEASTTDAIENYQVYGTSEGAGVETENLCPVFTKQGVINGNDGEFEYSQSYVSTEKFEIDASKNDCIVGLIDSSYRIYTINYYDENDNYISREMSQNTNSFQTTIPMTAKKAACSCSINPSGEWTTPGMLIDKQYVCYGSTAPDHYIPPGYKLPLTVESGAQSQDIPIYIGDTKLGEEEYVDYGEQKVYKITPNNGVSARNPNPQFTIVNNGDGSYRVYHNILSTAYESIQVMPYISGVVHIECDITFNKITTNGFLIGLRKHLDNSFYPVGTSILVKATETYKIRKTIDTGDVEVYFSVCEISSSAVPNQEYDYTISNIRLYVNPQDPPVPLQPIPTYKGENTLSVDTTVQPEKVAVEYEGWKGVGDVEKYQNGEWSDNNGT